MKFVAVIFLSWLVTAYAAPRIVDGQDAPDGKYPYMVSLRTRLIPYEHLCGGSILNKRWILTSAGCIERYIGYDNWQGEFPEQYMLDVYAGSNLISGGGAQMYPTEYLVTHPKWNRTIFRNDVGLVRVDRDIEFNDKIQPIALPKEDFNKPGLPVMFSGWGSQRLWGYYPNELQEVTLTLTDQQTCQAGLDSRVPGRFVIDEGRICTSTSNRQGTCLGDYGGPLVVDGVQIGISSFAIPCAVGVPDIFSRVYAYVDWIVAAQAKF